MKSFGRPALAAALSVCWPLLAAEPPAAGDAGPAAAAPSLFFSAAEAEAALRAIQSYDRSRGKGGGDKGDKDGGLASGPNIYVSAILDLGGGNWTVWANGHRLTPDHQIAEFQVLGVDRDRADIAVSGEMPAKFSLRPYQTWRAAHHDIVEGIVP